MGVNKPLSLSLSSANLDPNFVCLCANKFGPNPSWLGVKFGLGSVFGVKFCLGSGVGVKLGLGSGVGVKFGSGSGLWVKFDLGSVPRFCRNDPDTNNLWDLVHILFSIQMYELRMVNLIKYCVKIFTF